MFWNQLFPNARIRLRLNRILALLDSTSIFSTCSSSSYLSSSINNEREVWNYFHIIEMESHLLMILSEILLCLKRFWPSKNLNTNILKMKFISSIHAKCHQHFMYKQSF